MIVLSNQVRQYQYGTTYNCLGPASVQKYNRCDSLVTRPKNPEAKHSKLYEHTRRQMETGRKVDDKSKEDEMASKT